MLSVNHYDQAYIDGCRAKVDVQIAAYRDLVNATAGSRGSGRARSDAAVETFEPVFFNTMVLMLDAYFVHRMRAMEGKDGNPLNEVRVLGTSILNSDGIMTADKSIRLDPAASILGYEVGDVIAVREKDFLRLADAFFSEIEERYA
jgi:hypothetical protein